MTVKVKQPALSSPPIWLHNKKETKYWITYQGPNTEAPQTMGAPINNESTPASLINSHADLTSQTHGVVRFNCLRFLYDFSHIVGGSKLWRLCLHSLRSIAIFFGDRTRQSLQRPCRDRRETAQSSCCYHVIFTTYARKLHNVRAMSLRVPYSYLYVARESIKWLQGLLRCPHRKRALDIVWPLSTHQ